MNYLHGLILFLIPIMLYGAEREYFDYNFDGHPDCRIRRGSSGRLAYYDIYLYSAKKNGFEKHEGLSGLFNPLSKAEEKEIECFSPAGHSSMLYHSEVYGWEGNTLKLQRVIRQDYVEVGNQLVYIRVTSSDHNGRPRIDKIEHIDLVFK